MTALIILAIAAGLIAGTATYAVGAWLLGMGERRSARRVVAAGVWNCPRSVGDVP